MCRGWLGPPGVLLRAVVLVPLPVPVLAAPL
jgi:hypothetical protein